MGDRSYAMIKEGVLPSEMEADDMFLASVKAGAADHIRKL